MVEPTIPESMVFFRAKKTQQDKIPTYGQVEASLGGNCQEKTGGHYNTTLFFKSQKNTFLSPKNWLMLNPHLVAHECSSCNRKNVHPGCS